MDSPRLRNVEKYEAPFKLNQFPADFAVNLGRELTFYLAAKSPRLEGTDWEEIFARLISAEWKPSNVGLDDVVSGQCAWGAKTVKAARPATQKTVRLISGRNSPVYSFGVENVHTIPENNLGEQVLEIWNERVSAIRQKYKHLRTVVLLKSDDLLETAVFELGTVRYDAEQFSWRWNKSHNLEGYDRQEKHRFTWQPHGAQFTIIEEVPADRLAVRIKQPPAISKEDYLRAVGFNADWVSVL